MTKPYEYKVEYSERREVFEPRSTEGAKIRIAVAVDPGWPPHVYDHVSAAIDKAVRDLVAYEGPGRHRSSSTLAVYEPWPLPERPTGAT